MEVSVVIPTYNESENIRGIVEEVEDVLEGREHEILVVDDGSPDGTAEIVEEMMEEHPELRLIRRDGKRGLGAAYKDALPEAEGEKIVQMDADFSHPPGKIPELLEALEHHEVAVGSRYVEGGERKDPLHRRIFPLLGSYLYRVLLGSPVRDVTSGFKAYRKEVIEEVAGEGLPDGFHFQAASLFSALGSDASVTEVPIEFGPRRAGEPKYDTGDLVDNVLLLGKLSLKRRERMVKFGVVGATGVGVNMGLLYLLTEFAGFYYLFSAVFAVESSIVSNFVLNDLWTFRDLRKEGWRNWLERFSKFHAVSLAGMALNLSLLWVFTEVFGIYYLLSNLMAIAVVFAWNYIANVLWTWEQEI